MVSNVFTGSGLGEMWWAPKSVSAMFYDTFVYLKFDFQQTMREQNLYERPIIENWTIGMTTYVKSTGYCSPPLTYLLASYYLMLIAAREEHQSFHVRLFCIP